MKLLQNTGALYMTNRQLLLASSLSVAVLLFSGCSSRTVTTDSSAGADRTMTEQKKDQTDTTQPSKKGETMMTSDGKYVEFTRDTLSNSVNKKRVLFFYANWCPTCRPSDEDFSKNSSQIPDDAVLIRVNYKDSDTDGDEKALAEKYGITYQHTFVQIDQDGKEVAKWNGGQTKELLTKIQ